jgi:hypothetical protein
MKEVPLKDRINHRQNCPQERTETFDAIKQPEETPMRIARCIDCGMQVADYGDRIVVEGAGETITVQ